MRNPAACSVDYSTPEFDRLCSARVWGKVENRTIMPSILGIDVSKATLSCALRDTETHNILWESIVPNNPVGVQKLLSKICPQAAWVVEPTGRYSLPAVKGATDAGRTVLLAPPRQAKMYLKSLPVRAKTDKLDSRGLALFGMSRKLSIYPIKEPALEEIDQLMSARRGLAKSISKLQLQQQELPHAKQYLTEAIADLKRQQNALDKEIKERSAKEPAMQAASRLLQVPGIGPVTAAAVTARLSAKSFAHPDQFVAYIGLDVAVAESGTHKGRGRLTHQGDAELRRLLYVCAQANRRVKNSPFAAQYERERAKGLSSTAALCAVARKLARLCWSLHKHGTSYDAARVNQQPAQLNNETPKVVLDPQPS